ncbi:MAG: twin-arginine translocase subunit TatC, partial [Bacteroidota bacterium]
MPLDQEDVDKWEYDDEGRPVLPVEKDMSFLDHLEELRWHIIRALIAVTIIGIGLFIFKDWYFKRVLLGPLQDDFIGYRFLCSVSESIGVGGTLCFGKPQLEIITTNFGEEFISAIKYAFMGGLVFGFPYVFYEMWSFVRPGLYPKEQKATRAVIFICSFLFFLGVALAGVFLAGVGSLASGVSAGFLSTIGVSL